MKVLKLKEMLKHARMKRRVMVVRVPISDIMERVHFVSILAI